MFKKKSTTYRTDNEKQERFVRLLEPIYENLFRFVLAMTRNREETHDLVSETILIAYEKLDSLKDTQAFLSFLFTIAHRLHSKSRRRSKYWSSYDEQAVEQMHDAGAAPDSSAEVQALYNALALLPERQREALILYKISGLSLEEIRTIQGGMLSGVKSRIIRGMEQLRNILDVQERKLPKGSASNSYTHTSVRDDYFQLLSSDQLLHQRN